MNKKLSQNSTNKKTNLSKQSPKNSSNSSNISTLYFCHYKNAMYMGGIKSFKKDGKGILLHDEGLSVITTYMNDLMHGHNIFFSQHCLLSAEYVKGKIIDAVYRTDGYMTHLSYNNEGQLEGKCKLFNFINKSLIYATFRKGIMIQKQEEVDFQILNKSLIGQMHTSVIKYDIKKIQNINWQKYGNKLTIGLQKGGLFNGLAITLIFRGSHGGYNPQTHRNQDQFELRVVERGYMTNTHLNGFGEKLFKNGNLYIGQFNNNLFQGNGILKNISKNSWVYGYFQKGNLIDLLQYNNEGEDKKVDRIIEAMHQKKINWINNQIILFDINIFDKEIQKILSSNLNVTVKSLQQRKQDVLKKIQDNFLSEPNYISSNIQSGKNNLKLFDKQGEKHSFNRYVHSFIPQSQKNKFITANENSFQDGYQMSPERRTPNSIRKSKIFDKSRSFDKNASNKSASKNLLKNPQSKKKIFNFSSVSSKFKTKGLNDESSQNQGHLKQQIFKALEAGPLPQSSLDVNSVLNFSQRKQKNLFGQEGEKTLGKSKIFQPKNNQNEQSATKFIYTKIDTIKDSQKRKRLEYAS